MRAADVETGKISFENTTNKESINAMRTFEQYIFTGDDEGCVKVRIFRLERLSGILPMLKYNLTLQLWDMRKPGKAPIEIRENWDYISDLCVYESQNVLFATGGDERMSVIDFRKGKLLDVSQDQEDELLCVQVVKGGKKVIVGSQLGNLLIWTWGQWQDTTDRYPGHPESIDCMIAIDSDTIITGSADGVIRIVNVIPNRMIGIVGEHDDDMPVQRLAINHDKSFLGSCSDDNTIKFWNIKFLFEDDGEGEEEQEEEGEEETAGVIEGDDEGDADADHGEEAEEEEEEEEEIEDESSSMYTSDEDGDIKSKVRGRDRNARIPSKRKRDQSAESEDALEQEEEKIQKPKKLAAVQKGKKAASDDDEDFNGSNSDDEEDTDSKDGDHVETDAAPRVKADAKQKLSTLLTSLPAGQKLSMQERRALIKEQRAAKKEVKAQKKGRKEAAQAASKANQRAAPAVKKRKMGEQSESAQFFSDL